MKKIKVVCTEFVEANSVTTAVDSRFYNEDNTPIMIGRMGFNRDLKERHLGQVSSDFGWARLDCSYEGHFKHDLDILFPEANGDFQFEYTLVELKKSNLVLPNILVELAEFHSNNLEEAKEFLEGQNIDVDSFVKKGLVEIAKIKASLVQCCKNCKHLHYHEDGEYSQYWCSEIGLESINDEKILQAPTDCAYFEKKHTPQTNE